MRTGIFLQARLQSTRLPEKILLPLAGVPVLKHCMNSLQLAKADCYVVLTNEQSADKIREITNGTKWDVFVGSDEDVLDRYVQATKQYSVDTVLRATADNPAVSYEIARTLLKREERAPYIHFKDTPVGIGTELLSGGALLFANAKAKRKSDREHVSPYILEMAPDVIHLKLPAQYRFAGVSITLDTPEDYERLQRLFNDLYKGKPLSLDLVTSWCRVEYAKSLQ